MHLENDITLFKKKENKDTELSNNLYKEIIDITNKILSFNLNIKESNFNIVFEGIVLVLFCFFTKINNEINNSKNKELNQKLMNLFTKDIDHSLRMAGIDMSLGKILKKYIKKFYFRLSELDKIFKGNNLKEFKRYLIKYNLLDFLDKNQIDNTVSDIFNKLQKLIKIAQNIDNNRLLFKNLFN